jgi:hypothetical protein
VQNLILALVVADQLVEFKYLAMMSCTGGGKGLRQSKG